MKKYFYCHSCDYIGTNSELKQDAVHPCGKDECPECKDTNCISCCLNSYDDALDKLESLE